MDTTSNPKTSKLFIPKKIWQSMQEHAAQNAPLEACGLVSGRIEKGSYQAADVIPTTNILNSPIRYQIDPHEQLNAFYEMEASGLELVAIYHSHPHGPEVPSHTDIKKHTIQIRYTLSGQPAVESGTAAASSFTVTQFGKWGCLLQCDPRIPPRSWLNYRIYYNSFSNTVEIVFSWGTRSYSV